MAIILKNSPKTEEGQNHKDSRPPPASIRGLRKAKIASHNPYET